jgi:hypothetical protein
MGVNGHWYIEMEKQAFWRGVTHTFINRYVMSGAQPSATDAESVITAIHAIENQIFPMTGAGQGVGFVQGRAYPSGSGTFYANVNYNTSLAAGTATGFDTAGSSTLARVWAPTLETCLLLETLMTGLNSKGKPIYNRKYYRGVYAGPTEDNADGTLPGGVIATVAAITAPFKSGMGSSDWVVIANSGAQASLPPTAHPYLVARQIPRGKKKKTTSSGVLSFLADAAAKGVVSGGVAALVESAL